MAGSRCCRQGRAQLRDQWRNQLETAYRLLGIPLSPTRFAEVARPLGIENGLHWVLDVNMNEDQSRAPMNHAPRAYAPMGAKRVQARGIEGLDRRQAEASRLGRRFPRPPAHLPPANAIAPGSHRRVRPQTHLATSGSTPLERWVRIRRQLSTVSHRR